MNRYVVTSDTLLSSGARVIMAIAPGVYDLRDAIELCQEKNARHLRIWPDSKLEHHIYRLERMPRYIEQADLSEPATERTPEERAAFEAYLESSAALAREEECACGHGGGKNGNWPALGERASVERW